MEPQERGFLFVVSAPAGTGKSTLVNRLLAEFPDRVQESCSCTTRTKRAGEVADKDYFFLSVEAFKQGIEEQDFLEYASVFGNYYGTRKKEVERIQNRGKNVVLVIDTQGALALMGKVEATFIFITPPSLQVLRERLVARNTESAEKIEERLSWASQELAQVSHYDYHFVNDDLEVSYQILRSIIIARQYQQV